MIRLIDPHFPNMEDMLPDIQEVYESGVFSNGGKFCNQFENKISDTIDSEYAIAVSNGTSAIDIVFKALDIKNKKVLVPNFTFVATIQALTDNGCSPIYVDIDPVTLTMCPKDLGEKIHLGDVILAVDTFGNPCHYDELRSIAGGKQIIFDSAGAIASKYDGNSIGQYGIHCYSLHATKVLPVGEGGLISVNCPDLYEKIKSLINFGIESGEIKYKNGTNAKIDEIRCIFGLHGIDILQQNLDKRTHIASLYKTQLGSVCKFQGLSKSNNYNCQQLFPLIFDTSEQRDTVLSALKNNDIMCKIYYDTFDKTVSLPNTDDIYSRILCVPFHTKLNGNDITKICNVVKENI